MWNGFPWEGGSRRGGGKEGKRECRESVWDGFYLFVISLAPGLCWKADGAWYLPRLGRHPRNLASTHSRSQLGH